MATTSVARGAVTLPAEAYGDAPPRGVCPLADVSALFYERRARRDAWLRALSKGCVLALKLGAAAVLVVGVAAAGASSSVVRLPGASSASELVVLVAVAAAVSAALLGVARLWVGLGRAGGAGRLARRALGPLGGRAPLGRPGLTQLPLATVAQVAEWAEWADSGEEASRGERLGGDERARELVVRSLAAMLSEGGCDLGLLAELRRAVSQESWSWVRACQSPATELLQAWSHLGAPDRALFTDLLALALESDGDALSRLCASSGEAAGPELALVLHMQLVAERLRAAGLDESQRAAARLLAPSWQASLSELVSAAAKL